MVEAQPKAPSSWPPTNLSSTAPVKTEERKMISGSPLGDGDAMGDHHGF